MNYQYDLGFFGCGNMARAIIAGLGGSGLKIAVTDVNASAADGVNADFVTDNRTLASSCRYLLFAVKPFHAQSVFDEIHPVVRTEQCVISIMAGVMSARIAAELAPIRKVARVMPNLAAKERESMSALGFTDACDESDRAFVRRIFESVGKTVTVAENQMHAVTAVSGSGPAYVYEFIKHMSAAGESLGLDAATAMTLALQTVRGAVAMTEHADRPLDAMIDAVCSKGGTTIEAVKVLRARNFGETLEDAMKACFDRSVELSKES